MCSLLLQTSPESLQGQTVAPVLTWIRSLRNPPALPMGTGLGGWSMWRRHANANYLPSPHVTFFRSTPSVWEQKSPTDYLQNASFPWQEMTDKFAPRQTQNIHLRKMKDGRLHSSQLEEDIREKNHGNGYGMEYMVKMLPHA